MLAELRRYFAGAGVLEVETPLACSSSGTDPALQPVMARYTGPVFPQGTDLYLQTSPELGMKRLLAAGTGAIYQICKAFRDGEAGRLHNPEFSILEWYRPGFDLGQLMDELAEEYKGQIYVYKVDTQVERELASIFGIRSIPAVLFIPMEGKPQMSTGALPKETFKSAIDDFLLKSPAENSNNANN